MASNSSPSRSIWPEKSETRSAPIGSLPSRTLVAISQDEAALTISMFLVSAMIFRAERVRAGSSESHQSNACVSSNARNRLPPAREFALGKRLKEFEANAQLALQRPWLAFAVNLADRNEPGYWF